ncbi:unnamed protein product [Chilo suppressalis]|uniref:Uncharacterized protein n=1 Tax=Chilo suppressalis TaxID=168631 RepID=A0ABN8L7I6_CHISP|nr:unnamed protein product [Chilo suppressalis]
MELVSFAKEMLQSGAEHAASYRLGQTALRHLDRALWVVEKCARWAVPPPLDQEDRPQPELVRPLPWIFFLALLITLRVTRESISLINLVMGKPPLRSADVVMYIQSKRRYLRTLKYQGNRMMRARSSTGDSQHSTWYSRLKALLEPTMCFRSTHNYGNNNTTRLSNNDEVLVVKRSKRGRQAVAGAGAVVGSGASADSTMDRLIERMMQDLDADSDDDSSFTLTKASTRSDQSDSTESDQDTIMHQDASTPRKSKMSDSDSSIASDQAESSTPEKIQLPAPENALEKEKGNDIKENERQDVPEKQIGNEISEKPVSNEIAEKQVNNDTGGDEQGSSDETKIVQPLVTKEDEALQSTVITPSRSPKEDTQTLLQSERGSLLQHSPNSQRRNANGQIPNYASNKKGLNIDRRGLDPSNMSM